MINVRHYGPAGTMLDETTALFQKQWQVYRKVVDNNYLFHREAYNCLHRILVDEAVRPFRFLDLACGDAGATVGALEGTQPASYHGVDICQAALELASEALEPLVCPVTLDHRDFVEAVRDHPEPVDVAWISLSLHHLLAPAKLGVMRQMRNVVESFLSTKTPAQTARTVTLGFDDGMTRSLPGGRWRPKNGRR
jgi:SAM-dependent methyltransferase